MRRGARARAQSHRRACTPRPDIQTRLHLYEPLYDSYAKLDFARGADGINGPVTVALKSSED